MLFQDHARTESFKPVHACECPRFRADNMRGSMPNTIQAGTILVKQSTLLQSLGVESEIYSENWCSLGILESLGLDQKVRAAGWNLFFMAGELRAVESYRNVANRAWCQVIDIAGVRCLDEWQQFDFHRPLNGCSNGVNCGHGQRTDSHIQTLLTTKVSVFGL